MESKEEVNGILDVGKQNGIDNSIFLYDDFCKHIQRFLEPSYFDQIPIQLDFITEGVGSNFPNPEKDVQFA